MNINFNIQNHTWNASIHQLNSDILTRHILSQEKCILDTLHLYFLYDEATQQGDVLNSDKEHIGYFNLTN
ncbi:hypothetical protein HGG78_10695 [Vibrio aestuarianus]|nr:hypothetical protein [Vibrio sp. 1180_3]NGZ14197.1 hypothetical protein [Vibrio aestuarianus]NGZ63712.1 hypothetical protein [Vibrio aestuarianus subsp. cardii]NKZ50345.1 hypothetical protein [Vibrio aestuarianus]CAH8210684.1 conserved hypothetical protein [Vibrio aestuarianus]